MNKRAVIGKTLAAAMSVDTDVPLPSERPRSGSLTSMIADLKLGEVASKIVPIDSSITLDELNATISAKKESLRDNVQSSVSGARRRVPEARYRIECAQLTAASGVYVAALVTRVE